MLSRISKSVGPFVCNEIRCALSQRMLGQHRVDVCGEFVKVDVVGANNNRCLLGSKTVVECPLSENKFRVIMYGATHISYYRLNPFFEFNVNMIRIHTNLTFENRQGVSDLVAVATTQPLANSAPIALETR